MFKVIKVKSQEKPLTVEADKYIRENKLPEDVRYEVKNNIRKRREELGLTQEDVAAMLNITRQSVSLIEKGIQQPSMVICWLISKVLNADIQELFYIEEIEEGYDEKKK